jgi:hypothetical protein
MSILSQLSSQRHDRTEASNRKVVLQCLVDPDLLVDIAAGLSSPDAALAGDCAEVCTQVAWVRPDLIVPYAPALIGLLPHKNTRVRWEAVHALACLTPLIPDQIGPIVPQVAEMIAGDPSVIVRDHAVDILSRYAGTGEEAAREVYPPPTAALTQWGGKHAAHALPGLVHTARACPDLKDAIRTSIQPLLNSPKGVVRKGARAALKAVDWEGMKKQRRDAENAEII